MQGLAKQTAARTREARRVAAGNNLVVLFPEVACTWVTELNEGVEPQAVAPYANLAAWWRCACGAAYEALVANRTRGKSTGCPACSYKVRGATRKKHCHEKGVNLAALHPGVALELVGDPGPEEVNPTSHKKRNWRCSTCASVYAATPSDRTRAERGTGCPTCWARRRGPEKSAVAATVTHNFAVLHPELAEEWHPDNPLPPTAFAPRSNQKVRWKGRTCGHTWSARIAARTDPEDPRGCPFCSGQRVSVDRNFLISYPLLAEEWSPRNERGPETYSPGSNHKVWWTCRHCENEWEMTMPARTAGSGCSACSPAHRSKVEVWIAFELAVFLPAVDPTKAARIPVGTRVLRPDAILSHEHRLLFEYDGHRYHREGKDRARLEELQHAGWRVIAARETPLVPLNDLSFTVDGNRAWRKPHEVAQEVLRRVLACGVPVDVGGYLEATAPVARTEADAFLATRRPRRMRA